MRTGCLDDTGSVRTGVVRETASVGDSLGHFECLMLRKKFRTSNYVIAKNQTMSTNAAEMLDDEQMNVERMMYVHQCNG